ncbi:MAG: SpoVA/SpoVAEb family sporulation membrane protein [Clostridia bacterium]|nr:SpoVA/SpoVAEb family sporulation membrane protein [Clostridia bacterium]
MIYYTAPIDECKYFSNLAPIEHEYRGPNLTAVEGLILGVGAKMFSIAGPVIVYGTVASVVYGVIYWILQMI